MNRPTRLFLNETTAAFIGAGVPIVLAAVALYGRFVRMETQMESVEADIQLIKKTLVVSETEGPSQHFTALRPIPKAEEVQR